MLKNTFDIDFAVWGIEFIGDDLFAVVDKTADLAVFTNFRQTLRMECYKPQKGYH